MPEPPPAPGGGDWPHGAGADTPTDLSGPTTSAADYLAPGGGDTDLRGEVAEVIGTNMVLRKGPAEIADAVLAALAARDADQGALETLRALVDEASTWRGFDTRDIGHAYAGDGVDELLADLRAALARASEPGTEEGA
jgi:hypothetical protein